MPITIKLPDEDTEQCILVFGNPVDGFNFRGPFTTREEAIAYGDPIQEEWWVADLVAPDNSGSNDDDQH